LPVDVARREHAVRFYESDTELIEAVAAYLGQAIASGSVAVVAATDAHARAFSRVMNRAGVDVAAARAAGMLIEVDAAAIAAGLTRTPSVERTMFEAAVGRRVRTAVRTGRPVRVFGEIVAVMWEAGRVTAALQLEELWNALAREVPFSLLCAYPATVTEDVEHVEQMCSLHSDVVGRRLDLEGRESVQRTFPPSTGSPRAARRFVTEACAAAESERVVEDLAIVASELATNAILHARSPFTVTLSWNRDRVRVAVRDGSAVPPMRRTPSLETSGRGLVLVSALADRWGTHPVGEGKVVWAELRREASGTS